MDIGEDEHFQPSMAASGLTPPRYQKRFYARRSGYSTDGATTGCAYSRQTDHPRNSDYVLTGPCGGALLALVSRQTTSA